MLAVGTYDAAIKVMSGDQSNQLSTQVDLSLVIEFENVYVFLM